MVLDHSIDLLFAHPLTLMYSTELLLLFQHGVFVVHDSFDISHRRGCWLVAVDFLHDVIDGIPTCRLSHLGTRVATSSLRLIVVRPRCFVSASKRLRGLGSMGEPSLPCPIASSR